jgi:hypothetical protein
VPLGTLDVCLSVHSSLPAVLPDFYG